MLMNNEQNDSAAGSRKIYVLMFTNLEPEIGSFECIIIIQDSRATQVPFTKCGKPAAEVNYGEDSKCIVKTQKNFTKCLEQLKPYIRRLYHFV